MRLTGAISRQVNRSSTSGVESYSSGGMDQLIYSNSGAVASPQCYSACCIDCGAINANRRCVFSCGRHVSGRECVHNKSSRTNVKRRVRDAQSSCLGIATSAWRSHTSRDLNFSAGSSDHQTIRNGSCKFNAEVSYVACWHSIGIASWSI